MFYVQEYTPMEALTELVEEFLYNKRPLVYVKKETTQAEVRARNERRQEMTENIARFVNILRCDDYGDILENVPGIYASEVNSLWYKMMQAGELEPSNIRGRRPEVIEAFIEKLVHSQQAEDAASEIRRRKYIKGELELGELTDADREWFRASAEENRSQAQAFAAAAEAARLAAERAQAAADADAPVWDGEGPQ